MLATLQSASVTGVLGLGLLLAKPSEPTILELSPERQISMTLEPGLEQGESYKGLNSNSPECRSWRGAAPGFGSSRIITVLGDWVCTEELTCEDLGVEGDEKQQLERTRRSGPPPPPQHNLGRQA